MKVGVLLCAVTGHRWREAADVHETYPVLRCARCGRQQALASETHGADRVDMKAGADRAVGPWGGRR
jgi:hypothetical protein